MRGRTVQLACRLLRTCTRGRSFSAAELTGAAMVLGLCGLAVRYGTVVHPYLLADNRHYTFYIWKDVLRALGPRAPLTAAPYAVAVAFVLRSLAASQGPVVAAAWLLCTATAVVPAPLVEFRYFTIPATLAALLAPPCTPRQRALQAALFAAVNAATLWIFCTHPFQWPDGSTARFMW